MEAMTPLFLTIAEASEKTGRSHSTIRRLIKTITETTGHADREGVEPSIKEVEVFKKKGENFTWKIREDIVIKNFPGAPSQEAKADANSAGKMKDDILGILKKELGLKNDQIEKQLQVIQSLNERIREGNILMGSLQQRLSLPHPESPAASSDGVSKTEASSEAIHKASPSDRDALVRAGKKKVAEAKQGVSKKTSAEASVAPAKKGVFGWLFN